VVSCTHTGTSESSNSKFRQIGVIVQACELKDGYGILTIDSLTRSVTDQPGDVLELISLAGFESLREVGPARATAVEFVDKFEQKSEVGRTAVHVYQLGTTANWACRRRGHPSEVFAMSSAGRPGFQTTHL